MQQVHDKAENAGRLPAATFLHKHTSTASKSTVLTFRSQVKVLRRDVKKNTLVKVQDSGFNAFTQVKVQNDCF